MFHEATAQFCSLPAPKTEGFNPPGEALVQRGMTALFLEPPHYYYFQFSIYCILKMLLLIFGFTGSWLRSGLFSSCGRWGLLSGAVHGLLTVVASPVVEHGLSVHGSCSTWAQQLQLPGFRAQAR